MLIIRVQVCGAEDIGRGIIELFEFAIGFRAPVIVVAVFGTQSEGAIEVV